MQNWIRRKEQIRKNRGISGAKNNACEFLKSFLVLIFICIGPSTFVVMKRVEMVIFYHAFWENIVPTFSFCLETKYLLWKNNDRVSISWKLYHTKPHPRIRLFFFFSISLTRLVTFIFPPERNAPTQLSAVSSWISLVSKKSFFFCGTPSFTLRRRNDIIFLFLPKKFSTSIPYSRFKLVQRQACGSFF